MAPPVLHQLPLRTRRDCPVTDVNGEPILNGHVFARLNEASYINDKELTLDG